MAWIESHEEIADHHKTQRLAQILKCSIPTAVGTLHCLWHYTIRASWQFGDLSKHSPSSIARGCWYEGDPNALILALQEAGFLDENMKVHDWQIYAKHLIYQRLYNSKRKDKKVTEDLQCKNIVLKATTLPNLTIHNIPAFETVWSLYPRKLGKEEARRHFIAQVKTDQDLEDIKTAISNYNKYLNSEKTEERFIKHGSSWFNKVWRDWVGYKQEQQKPKLVEL